MMGVGMRGERVGLARLVVVVVLAGLAFMVGVQCSDGMSTAMPMVQSTMATPMDGHAPDTGTGESLAMCLVLVIAVAATAVVLELPAVRALLAAHVPSSAVWSESAQPRAPSLARLCSLRI